MTVSIQMTVMQITIHYECLYMYMTVMQRTIRYDSVYTHDRNANNYSL